MDKITIKICPLCSGTHLKHVMTCTDFYASGDSFELFSCEDCNFTFTQDFPSGSAMDRYYESSEYIPHSDTRKGIVNVVYHLVRKYMLGKKARLVMKEARLSSGKLLDIGTGTGYFPSIMARKGWETEAIEKDACARTFAKEKFNLDVKPEEALSAFEPDTFNVITLWHVMEHLEKLNETWGRLYELLTDKGVLIVAVPNHASYDAEKYGADWAAYDVPRHLWHFTSGTMQQFGSKHGFILAERYPMSFDAFYISMLSEKNMKKPFSFLRGTYTGLLTWFRALTRKEKSSSMIYVFRKKRNEK